MEKALSAVSYWLLRVRFVGVTKTVTLFGDILGIFDDLLQILSGPYVTEHRISVWSSLIKEFL